MAKVIYTPNEKSKVFNDLEQGTYFDYKDRLYLLVDEFKGIVFDFEEGMSFKWCDEFDEEAPVISIYSDRITIKVD